MTPVSCFFYNRDRLKLHYLTWGDASKPAVVLLHGLRAYAQTWESLAGVLKDEYFVISLDQRGRGLSEWTSPKSYHTPFYVNDVEDLVAELHLESFFLIGHSLGGANALEFTRLNPSLVKALVIEDIGPGSSSTGEGAERIRAEMRNTPLVFKNWAEAEAFWINARPNLDPAGLASRLRYSMVESDNGIAWRHDQLGIAEARLSIQPVDLWPAVRSLKCPTLFIRGEKSDFLPESTVLAMQQTMAAIESVSISSASHYVHDDQPALFNQAVSKFLNQQTN